MISRRVVNASPLIFLTHLGLLEVLKERGVAALVPDVVLAEIGGHGPADPAVLAVQASPWLQVVPTPPIPNVIAAQRLDAGESAVLAVGLQQPETQVVLDDLAARRCAVSLGLATQGTLGLVLVAKRLGLVAEVRPLLDLLKQAGLYVSDPLAARVLKAAGE